MKNSLILLAGTLCLAACAGPQRPEPELILNQKDVETQISTESVQGTAICGDLLFSMRHSGLCVVIDLKEKSLVSEFRLSANGANNHANVAFFGVDKYDADDSFPLLYVTQCVSAPQPVGQHPELDSLSRLLYVERVLTDAAGKPSGVELVQAVSYEPAAWNSRLWAYDRKHPEWLWCYGNTVGNCAEGNHIIVQKFRMPAYSPDNFLVTLTDGDVVEQFFFDEVLPEGIRGPQENILQGALVHDGIFYLPVGTGTEKHPSDLFYIDLVRRDKDGRPYLYGAYDYTDFIPHEMEDLDVWRDKLVCTTNSDGRVRPVYAFSLKGFKTKDKNAE